MESFAKIIDFFHPLTIFAKSYILDMWLGSECVSTVDTKLAQPRLNTSYVQVLVTFNLGCLSTDLANCQVYQRTPFKKNNFMAPFYGWGSTASRLEPLRGGSLLFTTKFPEVPGTHSIDLGRMKG